MPKRAKTPPPPEDEPRYLVVVHPYPLNPDLRLHADRRTLALWLACCIGKDALYAMFYKPTSPGMVIIEVDRYLDRFDALLGKHLWSSFLKHPKEEDRDKASKVFYCVHNTGRLVQKNGWKRVDVEEHWFHGWSPNNDDIKHPYPKTSYCDVPAEAQTGMPLCRPLPKDTFTPPAPRPRPTVGSAEWIHSRSSNVASEPPSSSRRRRGNGSQLSPSDSVSMISAPSDIGAAPPSTQPLLSQWIASQRASKPVWASPPSTISSNFTLSSSTVSSSVGSRTPSTLGMTPAAAPSLSRPLVPLRPPGLSTQSAPSLPNWSDEIEIVDDVPTSPQSAGASTTRAPGRRTAPPRRAPEPGAIDPDQDYKYEEEDVPKRSTADAMRDMFDGAPSVGNNAGLHDLEEEEEEDNYVAWNYPQAVQATTRDWTPAGDEDDTNPWVGYDAPRWEPPTRVNIKGGEEWICPEHGPTCNPGICKARAHLEAQRRIQKEIEERDEAKRKRLERRKKNTEKRERKRAQEEGREVAHDLPPHFPSHRYRGAGDSGSDSDSDDSFDSPADSESHSPPPFSPQDGAEGAESCVEEGSLWDNGDSASPKVSLPSSRSVTGSNGVEGEDEARSVGGPRTASSTSSNNNDAPGPRQSAWGRGTTSLPTTTTSARGTSSQWPAPGQSRSASNTRSTASAWTTSPPSSIRNGRSTGPDADAAPAPSPRQGNGRQNSLSSSVSSGRRSPAFHPVDGGFPTFADTTWGDPIAAAQSSTRKSRTRSSTASPSTVGAETADGQAGGDNGRGNVEPGQEQDATGQNERTGRGRRGYIRGGRRGTARRTATAPAAAPSASQDVAPANMLDVTLPPGGPGPQWCSDNTEW